MSLPAGQISVFSGPLLIFFHVDSLDRALARAACNFLAVFLSTQIFVRLSVRASASVSACRPCCPRVGFSLEFSFPLAEFSAPADFLLVSPQSARPMEFPMLTCFPAASVRSLVSISCRCLRIRSAQVLFHAAQRRFRPADFFFLLVSCLFSHSRFGAVSPKGKATVAQFSSWFWLLILPLSS
jgi:hypothetical protein